MNYISVDEFQQFNPEIDFSGYSDVTISGMVGRASKWVDKYLGYSLNFESVADEISPAVVTSDGDLIVHTKKRPIVSVSSIAIKLASYSSALTLQDSDGTLYYDIPEPKNHILYAYQQLELTGKVPLRSLFQLRDRLFYTKITYAAGYQTIPDDLKDAVNLVTKDIFMRQQNPMDLSSISQGGISISYNKQDAGESDLIKDAKRILDPYKMVYY
jgi:hypothetical protein